MSCLIMTPQIREIAKNLNMNPEECKDWIGYWQEQTGTNLEAYPTTEELNSFIKESMKDSFSVEEEISNYERGKQGSAESIFGNEGQRTITGENISSRGSEFAKRLTNQGNAEAVTFRGREFLNAEHAYQSWKTGEFDENYYNRVIEKHKKDNNTFITKSRKKPDTYKNANYWLMTEILEEKLRQHPDLVEGITQRGGEEYLEKSTHNVTGDKYWESEGENMFLNALAGAYRGIIGENAATQSHLSRSETASTTSTSSTSSTSTNNPLLERGIKIPKVNITRTGKVIKHKGNWSRNEAFENKGALYVFTDNTNRSSGRYRVGRVSKYYQKYNPESKGELYFPGKTAKVTAVVRGLDNAVPITTQRYYDPASKRVGKTGRWEDADFEEFKEVIDDDIAAIEEAWNNGNFTEIIFPTGDGIFNTSISNISQERTPLLYSYLYQRVTDLVNAIAGETLVNPEPTTTLSTPKESAQTISDILQLGEIVTTATQEKVNTLFSPQVRRDRVSLIARLFSNQMSAAMKELQERLGNRINNSEESTTVKEALQRERNSITRLSALQEYKPAGIFDRVYHIFKSYIDRTDEQRIAEELKSKDLKNSNLSDEEKLQEATRRANYKLSEYQKIIGDPQVFQALCQEACKIIAMTEGIDISTNYSSIRESDVANNDIDEENTSKDENDPLTKEETVRENWMSNFRNISSKASLSQSVRKALGTIPRLGYDGKYERDDLGFQRYLDPSYAHATIIDALRNMTSPGQMLSMLRKVSKSKPWVKQVVKRLDVKLAKNEQDLLERERLFTEFYTDFRKDFVNYSITKLLRTKNGLQLRTIMINHPEGIWFLLDQWKDNFESGTPLTKDSIYDTTGAINKEKVSKNLDKLLPLQKIFADVKLTDIPALLEEKDENGISNFQKIKDLLNAVGISTTDDVLTVALTDVENESKNPTTTILRELNYILKGIMEGKMTLQQKLDEDVIDEEIRESTPLDTFKTAYNIIADIISEVTEDAVESSVMENGKSYYSHNTPNYLGKLMKLLKNSAESPKTVFERFMHESYGQYEWFQKNGRWLNHWLSLLDTTGKKGTDLKEALELRKGLDHKVTLNVNKQPYSKLDIIDYLSLLISDYFAEPEGKEGEHHWAWYHVPVLSDKPSAEAIRFIKYKTEYDPITGETVTYEEKILDALKDVVLQEYDRIQLVRQRNANPNNHTISSYDKRGLEFCFFPALNTYKDSEGRSFLETLESMVSPDSNATSEEVDNFIKETLSQVMDEEFEKDFAFMTENGLLREANGQYSYLSFQFKKTQGAEYEALVGDKGVLTYAKAALIHTSLWTEEMETLYQNLKDCKAFSTRWAESVLDQIYDALEEDKNNGNITAQYAEELQRGLIFKNSTKEGLREYFWNSTLATSQIIELTTTDLAYYGNIETFQKRYAEVHSPSTKLNTLATYNGERVGKDFERTLYLEDEEIVSEMVDTCKEWVEQKLKNGEITNFDAANILAKLGYSNYTLEQKDEEGKVIKTRKYVRYGTGEEAVMVPTSKVNVADGQAYRTLDSYRCVAIMGGAPWGEEEEAAYQRLKEGEFNVGDLNLLLQPIKPFVYTQVSKNSGIKDAQGNDRKIKVPIQHKNSEFLLFTVYGLASAELGKPSKLRALDRFMTDKGIDTIQFESAVKVGKQGPISLEGIEDEQAVYDYLQEVTKANTAEEDPDIIQSIPYEDYGIQQNTPEHLFENSVQLVGTQMRKLIAADISDDAIINVNGKSLSKKEWIDLYNAINTENIIESFASVSKKFEDPKAIEELLQEEIRTNPRYGNELLKACTLDENGRFRIPLYDPIQCNRIQELLNSVIREAVTKQKIRGGSAIQVSSFGLSEGLHILYGTDKDGNKYIKGFECLLPATSRKLFEACMNEDGSLDISKLPEDLRRGIGYRIPTEDKYSMVPIYIKGFLPESSGAAIMLPAEITSIAGSDFDIDKLYLMLPTFKKVYNIEQAWQDFYNDPENKDIVEEIERNKSAASFLEERILPLINNPERFTKELNLGREKRNYEFSEKAQERFTEWFNKYKEYYDTGRVEKIKYDHNLKPQEQSRDARNNMLIDMMYGVLSNPDTLSKLLNPGGFDRVKKTSRIIRLLESGNTYEKLMDILKTVDIDIVQQAIKDKRNIIDILNLLDIDTLSDLIDSFTEQLNPLAVSTQVKLQQRNMIGANLIGIYANQNVNHALFQYLDAGITPSTPIIINGKNYNSLSNIYNPEGERISKNTAEFVGASVDNAKDPVLIDLNQNTFTANISGLLLRLGYNIQEVGLFMKQPAIVEITQNFFRLRREGISIKAIIQECLQEYNKVLEDVKPEDRLDEETTKRILSLDIQSLVSSIIYNSTKETAKYSTKSTISFYATQKTVIETLQSLLSVSEIIEDGIRSMKGDTSNGGGGPTFGDTRVKISDIEKFEEDLSKGILQIQASPVRRNLYTEDMSIDELREELLKSPLPYMQAFYTLGVEATQKLMGPYFPQLSPAFNAIVAKMEKMAKYKKLDAKTINNIYNELFTYYLSGIDFFGEQTINGNTYSSYQKRNVFINQFPAEFNRIKSTNKKIASIPLIRQMHVVKANRNRPVPALILNYSGSLDAIQKEGFQNDWNSLLYMTNPDGTPDIEARSLAINLFRYSYYRNGFAFGSNTFMHLAPVELKAAIPEYIDALNKLSVDACTDESLPGFDEFINQYIYNHLDNRKLVPQVSNKATFKFFETDPETGKETKKLKDKVTLTITEKSSYDDKSVVRDTITTLDGTSYDFFDFICKNVDNKDYYYRLNTTESTADTAVYERIDPLGWKHNFLEYEFGVPVEQMKSTIAQNDRNYIPSTPEGGQHSEEQMDALLDQNAFGQEVKSEDFTDADARELTDLMEGNGTENLKDIGEISNYQRSEIREVYKSMFGEELDLDNLTPAEAFDNIEDEDFECLDADGLPLCK